MKRRNEMKWADRIKNIVIREHTHIYYIKADSKLAYVIEISLFSSTGKIFDVNTM